MNEFKISIPNESELILTSVDLDGDGVIDGFNIKSNSRTKIPVLKMTSYGDAAIEINGDGSIDCYINSNTKGCIRLYSI